MANNFKRGNAAVNAEADAVGVALANGYLRIYDGSQPANADAAISGPVLLAELRWNNSASAFNAASGGAATAKALTKDSSANAAGTATWFRALAADGTTPIFDGTVGTASCDLNINSVAISAGAEVDVTAYTYTANKG